MRLQLHDKGYRWPPIGVEEEATCGNIMKVGRWQRRSPHNSIITQDVGMAYRLGRIPRSRGERAMKEEGGKNDGGQMMGRRVAGTGLTRVGEGGLEDCMRQRKEMKGVRGWEAHSATYQGKRYECVKLSTTFSDITGKIKETGRGLSVVEGRRKDRDRKIIYFNISQKTECGRMRKVGVELSKEGSQTGQEKSMQGSRWDTD